MMRKKAHSVEPILNCFCWNVSNSDASSIGSANRKSPTWTTSISMSSFFLCRYFKDFDLSCVNPYCFDSASYDVMYHKHPESVSP